MKLSRYDSLYKDIERAYDDAIDNGWMYMALHDLESMSKKIWNARVDNLITELQAQELRQHSDDTIRLIKYELSELSPQALEQQKRDWVLTQKYRQVEEEASMVYELIDEYMALVNDIDENPHLDRIAHNKAHLAREQYRKLHHTVDEAVKNTWIPEDMKRDMLRELHDARMYYNQHMGIRD